MTFTPNMPLGTQSLGQTQLKVLNNFSAINTTISQDHIAMNSTGAGKHKVIHIPNPQSINTSPGTGASEWNIYTKTIAGGAVELFVQRPGAALNGPDVQMTANVAPVSSNNGQTFLPGGTIMKWGFINFPVHKDHATGAITFVGIGLSNFPNNQFAFLTGLHGNDSTDTTASNTISIITPTNAGFTWLYNSSKTNATDTYQLMWWLAIGN